MTRHPGADEQGRPIVAELGRAETPDEAAARREAASEKRRAGRSTMSLAIALVASLGIVAFLILVVVRPDAQPLHTPVDIAVVADAAQSQTSEPLAVPTLPEGWYANRARFVTGSADGVVRWELGVVTAANGYLALTQGVDANPSWLADQVMSAPAAATTTIGGLRWTGYDRRNVDDPGNLAAALVATVDASTIVIGGTASDEEFAEFARAVAADLAR